MKNKLIFFIASMSLMNPLNVLAYSDYIIPGGENIGINIKTSGVIVIGFYEVDGKVYKQGLKVGDYIIKINNHEVNNISNMVNLINELEVDGKVKLTILRDNKEIEIDYQLIYDNGKYKTGLYAKDSVKGIGTLSYIDPETKRYGSLGHNIILNENQETILIDDGNILESEVTSIERSTNGSPGTKNANISSNTLGDVDMNTNVGIFGDYTDSLDTKTVKVGKPNELKTGKAYIRTVLTDNKIKEYEIKITKIDQKNKVKNIYFEIVDEELLKDTGGIVQGMSGSPIMQDDKIFGAVTHVVVDNVKKGYGVFITTMLTQGESNE